MSVAYDVRGVKEQYHVAHRRASPASRLLVCRPSLRDGQGFGADVASGKPVLIGRGMYNTDLSVTPQGAVLAAAYDSRTIEMRPSGR